jgi:hypothetical protein
MFLEGTRERFLCVEEVSLLDSRVLVCHVPIELILARVPDNEVSMTEWKSLCLEDVVKDVMAGCLE